jgi:hypothetical protein
MAQITEGKDGAKGIDARLIDLALHPFAHGVRRVGNQDCRIKEA